MKKEVLIAVLETLPFGAEVVLFDSRMNLHYPDDEGKAKGIYYDFEIGDVEVMRRGEMVTCNVTGFIFANKTDYESDGRLVDLARSDKNDGELPSSPPTGIIGKQVTGLSGDRTLAHTGEAIMVYTDGLASGTNEYIPITFVLVRNDVGTMFIMKPSDIIKID